MEQQQNELFAMIGELSYKLLLSQRDNERLISENEKMKETTGLIEQAYNCQHTNLMTLISENENLANENKMLIEVHGELQREHQACLDMNLRSENATRIASEITKLEEEREHKHKQLNPRLQRQLGHNDDELTDEQIRGFYGEGFMDDDDYNIPEWYEYDSLYDVDELKK